MFEFAMVGASLFGLSSTNKSDNNYNKKEKNINIYGNNNICGDNNTIIIINNENKDKNTDKNNVKDGEVHENQKDIDKLLSGVICQHVAKACRKMIDRKL